MAPLKKKKKKKKSLCLAAAVVLWYLVPCGEALPRVGERKLFVAGGRPLLERSYRPLVVAGGGGRYGKEEELSSYEVKEVGSTLVAMTWMAASVCIGSIGLMIQSVVPESWARPATRTLAAGLATFAAAAAMEMVVSALAKGAESRRSRQASMLAVRLRTLSCSLQALAMASASFAMMAEAWRQTGKALVRPMSLAAAPGAALMAGFYAWRLRTPSAVHGWVPFSTLLISAHAFFYDLMFSTTLKNREYGSFMAAFSVYNALVAIFALRCLALKGGAVGATKNFFFSKIPGIGAIASISVAVDFLWVFSTLVFWSFRSINMRWGLGVVAVVANVLEIAGARCADVNSKDDTVCQRLGALTASIFEPCSFMAFNQATYRAFWFDSQSAGHNRMQKHFLSILMTYAAFSITGAFRGHAMRTFAGTAGVTALLVKALYVSFYATEPLAFAGFVGLCFGLGLVAVALLAPNVFESAWGFESKAIFTELRAVLNSLY